MSALAKQVYMTHDGEGRPQHSLSVQVTPNVRLTIYGLLAMTRPQLIRALWDAHVKNATATAARVERELLRRGEPRR